MTVRGTIRFRGGRPESTKGRLYVRLLDVTTVDAPSRVVTEEILDLSGGGEVINFELRAQQIDQRARYVVAAHADLDGDGAVSAGDFITTRSYAVLSFGSPDHADLVLEQVQQPEE